MDNEQLRFRAHLEAIRYWNWLQERKRLDELRELHYDDDWGVNEEWKANHAPASQPSAR